MGPYAAVLVIGLACLSSSAQNNSPIPNEPWYFPPIPQSSSTLRQKTPHKQDDTAAPASTATPQDAVVLQLDLLATMESKFQPDPNSGLIKLDVVVTDQQGRSISGLDENDLTLLDNGQPRNIVTFQAFDDAASKPDPPVEIILVIDEEDLPALLLSAVKQAAQEFLLQNDGHLAQPTKVYRISNDGLFVSAQPSKDGNALAREVAEKNEPRTIWESQELGKTDKKTVFRSALRSIVTNTWSGLPHPLIALGSIAIEERRTPARKLLFWFGNGWPIVHKQWQHLFDSVTEISTRLREARIGVWVDDFWRTPDEDAFAYQNFVAGVASENSSALENLALQVLAVQSGGGVLQGNGDAADLISRQVAQANTFYTITFDPPRTYVMDEYHDLNVAVGRPGLTTHTRTGYYDQPAYYDQARTDAEDVTVSQLRDSIGELQHASDSEAQRRLRGMELTERLSSSDLAKWLARLKGKKAQEALTAVADQSVFLSPPAEDTLSLPPPSIADQRRLIQRPVSYVSKTIPLLPNLSAERNTTLYVEPLRAQEQTWKTAAPDRYLEEVSTAKAAVDVSNGKENANELPSTAIRLIPFSRSLHTEGVFGPILASVLVAVSKPQSRLIWAQWEKGDNGPLAVFRYYISKDTPIFKVGFRCIAVDFGQINFETDAPTYGEIAVDPGTGAILRLTIRAAMAWRLPLQHSDIMVEYGPVILGGTSYICPTRSVSISRQRSVVQVSEFGEIFRIYAPFETILNDVKYENYHLFRSSSRVLPGFSETPEVK
jgi:VWFA-related protein